MLAPSSDALLVGEHQSTPGPAADAVRHRGARRRRPPVDHADLPRPQPGRAGAGAHGARRGRASRACCARPATSARRACGPDVTQVFDLDGTRLAALAAAAGLVADRPGSARGRAAAAAARPGGGQAARRGPAVRAEPREQPGGRRPLRRRGPGAPGRRCRSSPGSRCTPTSARPGSCRPSRGCTSTTPRSRRCSPPRTRWRPGSPPRSTRRARCWRSRGSWASTCPGWRPGAARRGRRGQGRDRRPRRSGGAVRWRG